MNRSLLPAPHFEARVRDLSKDGLGVLNHPNGQVCFAAGTWPGDVGTFRLISEKKNYAFAELVELTQPASERGAIPCAHHGIGPERCGGCPWQMVSYPAQLKAKAHRVEHALQRAGLKTPALELLPIIASDQTLGYRNRAQFKSNGQNIGYFAPGTHHIVPIEKCVVLNEPMAAHLANIRERLQGGAEIPKPEGFDFVFIDLDDTQAVGSYPINERRPFRQGNSGQNEKMRNWVRERFQALAPEAEVLELFCGSGNFTELLAARGFKKIWAVEVVEEALTALREKNLPGVEALAKDLHDVKNYHRLAEAAPLTQHLLLDPTRDGAKGIEKLARSLKRLETITYVSCDLETFVRDAQQLKRVGFELRELQPLDLFPHTAHVEILAVFARAK